VLSLSVDDAEIHALYHEAGLDLGADLNHLNHAPRISPDRNAVRYLVQNVVFNGRIPVPVLTIHTTSDWLVPVEHEQSYREAVRRAGNADLLRQLFIHRPGHCAFSDAEMLTALDVLVRRIHAGDWPRLHPAFLNAMARRYPSSFQQISLAPPGTPNPVMIPALPSFTRFTPPPFMRPFLLPPGGHSHLPGEKHR
jgi:hypothetical protein